MDDTARIAGAGGTPVTGDFVMIAGRGQLRTHLLDKVESVIGRDPSCDIVIDDRSLSRRRRFKGGGSKRPMASARVMVVYWLRGEQAAAVE